MDIDRKIPFNKPYLSGKELYYIAQTVNSGRTSGNNKFTKQSQDFFQSKYNFGKCLLTTSCTDALEMTALLSNIEKGDEVILPSYTFVSTANAFALRGAKLKFADCLDENPNIDPDSIESLISERTKVIIVVHYAGIACDMDRILDVAARHNIIVVEDAAQAIHSKYKDRYLGGIGHFSTFSFHETKNIICGEGGMLVVNDKIFNDRAEIIWEKGTNRSAFYRGEVDKYGWMDIGSSFLMSDILASYLYAQLENLENIQDKRISLWNRYDQNLKEFLLDKGIGTPYIPNYATNNGHIYYIVCSSLENRTELIKYLKQNGIHAVFHYLPLHKSKYFKAQNNPDKSLVNCERYADCLLRLPLFYELSYSEVDYISNVIKDYYLSH